MLLTDVHLLEENFVDTLPDDERFRKVRVVLYNAHCSKSGVTSPVDYVLQEGAACVHDLVNNVQSNKLRGFVVKHQEAVKHAMKFHFVHYIVYATSSIHKSENEDVIKKVVEENTSEGVTKNSSNPFVVVSFLPDLKEKLMMHKANPLKVTDVSPGQGDTFSLDFGPLHAIRLSVSPSSVCLSACQSVCPSVFLPAYLSVFQLVCQSVSLFICLPPCWPTYLTVPIHLLTYLCFPRKLHCYFPRSSSTFL